MRKLVFIVLFAIAGVLFLFHQRLFLRDPFGSMSVDGAKVAGAQVYINYSNDVLVLRDSVAPLLVQNWDRTPGMVKVLPCMRWMACLTDADLATKTPMKGAATMSNRDVTFTDDAGKAVRIVVR